MEKIDFKGRKILLVGGAGFIGHHLALRLKSLGAEVSIVDGLQVNNLLYFAGTNNKNLNRNLYMQFINERLRLLDEANVPVYVQDARDYMKLTQIFNEVQPEIVVQLAAVAHADRSNKDPFNTFDHSLRTLENALDCSRVGVKHFIFFSSSMVYGHFKEGEVSEDTICEPLGIYGALKYAGEKIVIAYKQVFGIDYTIVRPSALYGERCVSRRVGQIFAENAIKGLDIMVHGDGTDRLDFTYIDDLVQGIERIIENPHSRNQIFNITYGKGRSIADIAEILKTEFPEMKVNYVPKDNLMPDRGTLCIEKAKKMIGYEPVFPIEKGIVKYINWYKSL
jgi:nucleoside-diphosphate-sugar epimerase